MDRQLILKYVVGKREENEVRTRTQSRFDSTDPATTEVRVIVADAMEFAVTAFS
jgi:hypothetical protein